MGERLTRDVVVEVALDLLADGGLHALAMRRIASSLGVQQSALYWYFDNKQKLLAAVADRLLAGVELAPAAPRLEDRLVEQATRLRHQLLRYPDGAELVATAFAFRLGAERPYRQFASVISHADLRSDDADVGATVLFHFVCGYVTDEQQNLQAAALGAIESTPATEVGASDARFDEGLRVIAAGLVARSRPV